MTTLRERADEVMDVTWGGWGSGDPWQQVPAFVTHRDRIEAAIIAATGEERELCARIAEPMCGEHGFHIAAAIRAPDEEPYSPLPLDRSHQP